MQHPPNANVNTANFPCPFLRFVSTTRDVEHLKFQLDVNHCDNDRRDQVEETKETLGQKIFRIFKPDTPPHQKAARKLLLEARRARTPGSKKK